MYTIHLYSIHMFTYLSSSFPPAVASSEWQPRR